MNIKLTFAVLLLLLSLLAEPVRAAEINASPPSDPHLINGYFSLRGIDRSTEIDGETFSDQDLFSKFRLDITRPKDNSYEFHFFGINKYDLDGRQDETGFNPFEEISDTREQYSKIYTARFDINQWSVFKRLSLGRQHTSRGEWVIFDGLTADMELTGKIDLTLYGGLAVHFDEKSSAKDTLGGAGLDYSPFRSSKFYLDLLSLKDQREHRKGTSDQNDKLVSFRYWQKFSENSKLLTKFRWINGAPKDIKINSSNLDLPGGFDFNLIYFRQLRTQNELSNEISSLYDVVGQLRPYHFIDLKTHKAFGDDYSFEIGYFQRQMLDYEDESPFNRNYKRVFSVFEMRDILTEGLGLSLTAERWDSSEYEGSSNGFDIQYKFGSNARKIKLNAGSYFSLYQYEWHRDFKEETNVRTNFVKIKLPIGENYCLKGEYSKETSVENYQTLKLELRRDF